MWLLDSLIRPTFSHGVHPPENKESTQDKPIRRLSFAPRLLIPLSSHLAFGFVGGLIGALMAIATQRALTNRH